MNRTFLVLFILIGIFASQALSVKASFGQKCKMDSDCGSNQMRCYESKCKNKALFPMHGREIAGMVIIVFLSMFATIAGIGGGPVIVPILLIFFKMTQKETIALSNGLIIFNGFSKLFVSLTSRDPEVPRRVLMNYDVMIIFTSLLLLSSAIGTVFSEILAEIVPMITFFILASYALFEAIKKTMSLCKKERAENKKQVEQSTQRNNQIEIPNGESAREEVPLRVEEPLREDFQSTEKKSVEKTDEKESENQPEERRNSEASNNDVKQIKPEIGGVLLSERNQETSNKNTAPLDQKPLEEVKIVESLEPVKQEKPDQKKSCIESLFTEKSIVSQEGKNFSLLNMAAIFGIFVISNLVTFLRGGSGVKSVIGVKKCSGADWTIFVIYILISLIFSFVGTLYVMKKHTAKISMKILEAKELVWTKGKVIFGWCFMLFAGAAASISGLGGGSIMTPFMYNIELMPQSASATSLLLTFLSKIVVTLLNYFTGTLLLDYFGFIGVFLFISSLTADIVNSKVQKKLKKQSIVSTIFAVVMVICIGLFIASSVNTIDTAKKAGTSIVKFGKYCK